jgi:hypothetical protein
MKALLLALVLTALPTCAQVEVQTNGFLIFEVDRFTYTEGNPRGAKVKQSFKVPVTPEFTSQFKNVPSQNGSGTGFYCSGGSLKGAHGSTAFTWWIRKTADNRWAINMWGRGVENIKGTKVSSWNPSTSQYLTIKRWEDLDMTYMLSYVSKYDGMNITFRAKYVAATDIDADADIPTAPVKRSDQTQLFKGDDSSKLPLELRCGFQEG